MTRKILLVVSGLAVALTLLWCQASLGKEKICKNLTYGFSFPIPEGMRLYTPEHPGPFTFKPNNIYILANWKKPSEFIMVNTSEVHDDKDLQEMKSNLEAEDMAEKGYKKDLVRYVTIGKNQATRAVEHIFTLQGKVARTMRQICCIHNGKGIFFTCSASADRFQEANQAFFEPVFRSITFE